MNDEIFYSTIIVITSISYIIKKFDESKLDILIFGNGNISKFICNKLSDKGYNVGYQLSKEEIFDIDNNASQITSSFNTDKIYDFEDKLPINELPLIKLEKSLYKMENIELNDKIILISNEYSNLLTKEYSDCLKIMVEVDLIKLFKLLKINKMNFGGQVGKFYIEEKDEYSSNLIKFKETIIGEITLNNNIVKYENEKFISLTDETIFSLSGGLNIEDIKNNIKNNLIILNPMMIPISNFPMRDILLISNSLCNSL